jgi:hypothetical protein
LYYLCFYLMQSNINTLNYPKATCHSGGGVG